MHWKNDTRKKYAIHQWIEGLKTFMIFLKHQKPLAVPFDRVCGVCVMKQITYLDKQNEINSASQFDNRYGESDNQTVNIEKQINSSLHQIKKRQR